MEMRKAHEILLESKRRIKEDKTIEKELLDARKTTIKHIFNKAKTSGDRVDEIESTIRSLA